MGGANTKTQTPPKSAYNFTISPERLAKMTELRDRVGIPIAEQIRRGVDLWLKQQEAGK
jgi:hypothetical protein